MPTSNLAEFKVKPLAPVNLGVRPVRNVSSGEEFHSINHEEANPSGHDPFNLRLLDPDLAFRLGL